MTPLLLVSSLWPEEREGGGRKEEGGRREVGVGRGGKEGAKEGEREGRRKEGTDRREGGGGTVEYSHACYILIGWRLSCLTSSSAIFWFFSL